MPGDQLNLITSRATDRRRFIARLGAVVGGAFVGFAESCGGDSSGLTPPTAAGTLRGSVVDRSGHPQGIGRIFLLQKNGFNSGVYADVDTTGKYEFGLVAIGEYLLRFWGGNEASVPETLHNPVRITVTEAAATVVQFQVEVGTSPNPDREIYAGDFFFQEQPIGVANSTTVVNLNTLVCWYNVGQVPHTVTGGPWGDSGPIAPDGNFMWVANQAGTFPYHCSYHGTQMITALQVLP